MAKFSECIDFVLKHEGGILNDKYTGEFSNFGITKNLLEAIDYFEKDPSKLTLNDAKNIYLEQFWKKYKFDLFDSNKVARKIFDMYVNLGPRNAAFVIQDAIGLGPELRDGILGHFTRGEINEMSESEFLTKVAEQLTKYYTKIATGHKEKYLAGWLVRANEV